MKTVLTCCVKSRPEWLSEVRSATEPKNSLFYFFPEKLLTVFTLLFSFMFLITYIHILLIARYAKHA